TLIFITCGQHWHLDSICFLFRFPARNHLVLYQPNDCTLCRFVFSRSLASMAKSGLFKTLNHTLSARLPTANLHAFLSWWRSKRVNFILFYFVGYCCIQPAT